MSDRFSLTIMFIIYGFLCICVGLITGWDLAWHSHERKTGRDRAGILNIPDDMSHSE